MREIDFTYFFNDHIAAELILAVSPHDVKQGGVDDWDDGFGFALQAGFDYAIDDKWSINMDIKKVWLNVDATVTGAAFPASVDLDS